MPPAASGSGKASALNCGLARERGTERTSTSRLTPASFSSATSSPAERVEWPIVKIVFPMAGCRHSRESGNPGQLPRADPLDSRFRGNDKGSIHVLAAIDREGRAGDEIGFVGDQEQDGAGDVLGLAEAADRDARDDLFEDVGG